MDAPISSPRNGQSTNCSSQISPINQAMGRQLPAVPNQGQVSSADTFLSSFTLVAEAAKRAQVAVMVRDFESCGLS